ncbi:actin-histidine N-methyltransferase-like [Oppia nitens]|uniref:actin-histidine N-methyltransferase-like n=1 Tax=Oppia nitens TaxID=1686743 RepID=UPI0023D98472|nr:actin-histidine N-methyltransferase-like [Oppia nitens]
MANKNKRRGGGLSSAPISPSSASSSPANDVKHPDRQQQQRRRELTYKSAKRRLAIIDDLLKKCTYYNNNTANNGQQLLDEHKDINQLLDEIMVIEKDIAIDLPKRLPEDWTAFEKWLKNVGDIDMSRVDIRWIDDKHGYGLFAKTSIGESEPFLEIPRKLMMSRETALTSDDDLATFIREDLILQNMPNIAVALHVINEYCKPDSFWRPYLQCLPPVYETAIYLTDDDMNQLKGTQILDEVIKLKRSIARQYAYFADKLLNNETATKLTIKKCFTYELYRWAVSTVMTRQNAIPSGDGQSMTTALIPLWDMCNHKHGKLSTDYDLDADSVICRAMMDFQSGEQIFIYYGPRSNGEFFIHNGFVYISDDNNCDNDFLPFKLGVSRNDGQYQRKCDLYKRLNLNISGIYHLYSRHQPMDKRLLAFLRVFHLNQDELDHWLASDNLTELFNSDCNDLMYLNEKIWQFLAIRCTLLLKAYPNPESVAKYNTTTNNNNRNVEQLIKSEMNLLKSYV